MVALQRLLLSAFTLVVPLAVGVLLDTSSIDNHHRSSSLSGNGFYIEIERDRLVKRREDRIDVRAAIAMKRLKMARGQLTESDEEESIKTSVVREGPLHPVILVPGDGGSQLEAKLNKTHVVHYFCQKKSKSWFDLWLNLESLLPYAIDCFADNIRLDFDARTHDVHNPQGVKIRVPGFGNTSTVEWLDPSEISPTHYFYGIADFLVKHGGYVRDVSIRGAPYDFRLNPRENEVFMKRFRLLVEETYRMNNGSRVVLIAHSLGNLVSWRLLDSQPQSWRDRYIESFISISAPWAGSTKSVKMTTSGDNLGVFVIERLSMRVAPRSWPSLYALYPQEKVFGRDTPMVEVIDQEHPDRSTNYSLATVEQLMTALNYSVGWQLFNDHYATYKEIVDRPPRVRMHCVFGIGVETGERYVYEADSFPDGDPEMVVGDGDGTVNRASMEVCTRWTRSQSQPIDVVRRKGAGHLEILNDKETIHLIGAMLGVKVQT